MEKVIEIIKDLSSEPEKTKGLLITCIKIILVFVFAEWLYRHYLHTYKLINFFSVTEWLNFLLSGRVFICVILMYVSYFLLFQLLPIISFLLFSILPHNFKIANEIDKEMGGFLLWIFRISDLIDYDETARTFIKKQNTDLLLELSDFFCSTDGHHQIRDWKLSLLLEIGHTYFVFLLIYFSIIPNDIKIGFINSIIWVGFISLIILYFLLNVSQEFIIKIAPEVRMIANWAKLESALLNKLKESGIYVTKVEELKNKNVLQFNIDSNIYFITGIYDKRILKEKDINYGIELAKKYALKLIILTNGVILNEAKEKVVKNNHLIAIISFSNEEELIDKLLSGIQNKFT